MRLLGRRRSIVIFSLSAVLCVVVGGAIFSRLRAQETREQHDIAPGLSLLSVTTSTPNGPLRYWLVKADKTLWNLGLEVADSANVIKKRSVRNLAAQSKARVAINGGFFAYGGAAVGAVKVGGEWNRLPWKSRTALGWGDNGAKIGPLSGQCNLKLDSPDGTSQTVTAALNGFSLPGSHAPLTDGFCVLTRHFAEKYKLQTGEIAIFALPGAQMIEGNAQPLPLMQKISTGEVAIPENGFIVIARGQAAASMGAIAPRVSYTIQSSPDDFDQFPQIIGAGPRLVENSLVKTTEVAEEFRPDVVAQGPRTAVGFDADGNWLFLVTDGRQFNSVGLTIPDTAQLFKSLGAVEAMNLDGGSSTQLVIDGQLVNRPSGYDPVNPNSPREVQVSNALVLREKPQ